MATDAVRYRRQSRQETARAAKQRREKIILVVGFALLLGIVAFEGPKTLKRLHGSSTASTSAPAIAPSPTAAVPAAPPKPVSLKRLARFAAKDPFVPQVGIGAGSAPTVLSVYPPAVRTSHFVQKDPFIQQLTVSSGAATGTTAQSGGSTGQSQTPAAAGAGSLIVVVASVPVGAGRGEAMREAAAARAHGVPNVSVVLSSNYPTLRTGYYAVYSGPYSTLARVIAAVERIRGLGYVSAYTRRLGH
jgi:hypothetical protein